MPTVAIWEQLSSCARLG